LHRPNARKTKYECIDMLACLNYSFLGGNSVHTALMSGEFPLNLRSGIRSLFRTPISGFVIRTFFNYNICINITYISVD